MSGNEELGILTGINGSKIVSVLSNEMNRKDWISFAKEFPSASADNLVRWHLSHKKKDLLRLWILPKQALSSFITAYDEK